MGGGGGLFVFRMLEDMSSLARQNGVQLRRREFYLEFVRYLLEREKKKSRKNERRFIFSGQLILPIEPKTNGNQF